MRRRAVIYLCVLAGALGAIWLPTSAQSPGGGRIERVGGRDAVAREALVKFRRAPRATDLDALSGDDIDAEDVAAVGRTGVYRVRSRSVDAAALVARLARRGDVLYAEPNYILSITTAPNDPSFPSLWGLENLGQPVAGLPGLPGADIRATDAWDVSTGSPNTVVAVIDTGVDYTHEDLAANMWTAPAPFTVNRRRLGGALSRGIARIQCDPQNLQPDGRPQPRHACGGDDRRRRQQSGRRRRGELDHPDHGHQVPQCRGQRRYGGCDRQHPLRDRSETGFRRIRRRQHSRALEQLGRWGLFSGPARRDQRGEPGGHAVCRRGWQQRLE